MFHQEARIDIKIVSFNSFDPCYYL